MVKPFASVHRRVPSPNSTFNLAPRSPKKSTEEEKGIGKVTVTLPNKAKCLDVFYRKWKPRIRYGLRVVFLLGEKQVAFRRVEGTDWIGDADAL